MLFCPDVPISEEQLKILISQTSDKQSHYNSFFASYSIDNRKKVCNRAYEYDKYSSITRKAHVKTLFYCVKFLKFYDQCVNENVGNQLGKWKCKACLGSSDHCGKRTSGVI